MKKQIVKFINKLFSTSLGLYHKSLSCLLRVKTETNHLDFTETKVRFTEDVLSLPAPKMNKMNPSYVFVRHLAFQPEIKINKMQDFKSLLKWKLLSLPTSVVMRDYPLGFSPEMNSYHQPELTIKVPPKVLEFKKKDINITKKVRTHEEIIKILPYVRKINKKKLLRVPMIKRPLYKNDFSREEMKKLREIVAEQNNTSWVNVQIYEIYDKFYSGFFTNIKQVQDTKNLECYISSQVQVKQPDKNLYLVLGQLRDNKQHVKAIVDPADIKNEKTG